MNARVSLMAAAVIAVVVAAPARAAAQGAFEGVVTFQMDAGRQGPATMQYSVKGENVRMDMSVQGMDMFTLFNGATKTARIVIPMQQMYMERAVDPQEIADSASRGKSDLTWTGRKETVAGHECEHATITDDAGTSTDVCLAKGLGTFVQIDGGGRGRGGPPGGGWEGRVANEFPLKVQQNGRTLMEATKIERKTLDPSIFTVPDGYQKMDVPMGGRGGV